MFGMSRKERLELSREMMWRNARREGWTSVDDCLPNPDQEVEVLGKAMAYYDVDIGKATFNPKKGWQSRFTTIYAWRRAPELLDLLKEMYPGQP